MRSVLPISTTTCTFAFEPPVSTAIDWLNRTSTVMPSSSTKLSAVPFRSASTPGTVPAARPTPTIAGVAALTVLPESTAACVRLAASVPVRIAAPSGSASLFVSMLTFAPPEVSPSASVYRNTSVVPGLPET